MTLKEAALKAGVSHVTMRRWLTAGLIPGAHKTGVAGYEAWDIPAGGLAEYMARAGREAKAAPPAVSEGPGVAATLDLLRDTLGTLKDELHGREGAMKELMSENARLHGEVARLTRELARAEERAALPPPRRGLLARLTGRGS